MKAKILAAFMLIGICAFAQYPAFNGGNNDGNANTTLTSAAVLNLYKGGNSDGLAFYSGIAPPPLAFYSGGYKDGHAADALVNPALFNMYAGGYKDGNTYYAVSTATNFSMYSGGNNDGAAFYSGIAPPALSFYTGGHADGAAHNKMQLANVFVMYTGGTADGFAWDDNTISPPAPCTLSAQQNTWIDNITTSSGTFHWYRNNTGSSYEVVLYLNNQPVNTYTGTYTQAANSLNVTGLSPNTTYCLKFREFCNGNLNTPSNQSSAYCFTTVNTPPPVGCTAPTNQSVGAGNFPIELNWNSVHYPNSNYWFEISGGYGISSPAQATYNIALTYSGSAVGHPIYYVYRNAPGFTWWVRDICGAGDTSAWVGPYIIGSSKTDETTSLDETAKTTEWIIYPNPNHGQVLYINTGNADAKEIRVNDVTGKFILQKQTGEEQLLQLDVSSLSSGIYIVQLVTGNEVLTKPLSINK